MSKPRFMDGVNQVWILKNSKYLIEYIPSAVSVQHMTYLPSTQQLFPTLN